MRKSEPPKAVPGTCLLKRLDYGYEHHEPGAWKIRDVRYGLPSSEDFEAKGGLLLRSGDLLLSWSKINSNGELWKFIASKAAGDGLVIECRFPRWCDRLREALKNAGAKVEFWETPVDGSVPPLYKKLHGSSQLLRVHLDFEWETGLAAARGGVGLTRFAVLLAGKRRMSVRELAGKTGLSPGAVRSYLGWMEAAALVRREDHTFALRHPLLAELFGGGKNLWGPPFPRREPPVFRNKAARDWDPVELD